MGREGDSTSGISNTSGMVTRMAVQYERFYGYDELTEDVTGPPQPMEV